MAAKKTTQGKKARSQQAAAKATQEPIEDSWPSLDKIVAERKTRGLKPMQAVYFWKLVLEGASDDDGPLLNNFKPKLDATDRMQLQKLGLISLKRHENERGQRIHIPDAAWDRVPEFAFAVPAPGRSPVVGVVLAALLTKIGAYLEVHNLAVARLLKPRRSTPEPTEAALAVAYAGPGQTEPAEDSLEERIRAAYLRVTRGAYQEQIKLARLRAELPGEAADAIDTALLRMQQNDGVVLYQIDDPHRLRPEDEAAALRIAGTRKDLVCIER